MMRNSAAAKVVATDNDKGALLGEFPNEQCSKVAIQFVATLRQQMSYAGTVPDRIIWNLNADPVEFVESHLGRFQCFYVGITHSPLFRMFGSAPNSKSETCRAHAPFWTRMHVVFVGSASDSSTLERRLIAHFKDQPSLENKRPGGEQAVQRVTTFVYILENNLHEQLEINRRERLLWVRRNQASLVWFKKKRGAKA